MKNRCKTFAIAGATLALSATMLAGCSTATSDTDATTTSDDGYTLVVGFDQSYPPYGFIGDDGEYTGFDLDLAAEVAARNGWDFEAVPIDWDAKDAELNSGTITCIWNGFTLEGREGSYAFSDPYMLNEQVIVVRADSDILDEDDLAGATVITQVDSAALDVLEGDQADLAETFASLETIGDYNTAFMNLEAGIVDAVACDLSIAEYQMAANPGAYTIIVTLSSEHYAVGFALGDEEYAQIVTDTLIEMYEDGTIAELCEKYADYGLSIDNWILGVEDKTDADAA